MDGDRARAVAARRDDGRIALTRTQLIAITAGAALVGATVGFLLFRVLAVGDEPPIRVKGGSIHFDLLRRGASWAPQGNPADRKKWQVHGSPRDGDDLSIYFAAVNPAHCTNATHKKDKKIKFIYHDLGVDYEIELKVSNRKTMLDSRTLDLVVDANDPTALMYKRADETENSRGFIKEIWVGNESAATCTFTAGDQLKSVLIVEEP